MSSEPFVCTHQRSFLARSPSQAWSDDKVRSLSQKKVKGSEASKSEYKTLIKKVKKLADRRGQITNVGCQKTEKRTLKHFIRTSLAEQ